MTNMHMIVGSIKVCLSIHMVYMVLYCLLGSTRLNIGILFQVTMRISSLFAYKCKW